jgi:hypothetical protein
VLATIGATAPFVGLFGTVWGIMNSFIGISEAHTTNLAVVAPGIAEALLATALGLVAAIPAVVIYNHLTRTITAHRALLGDASAMVLLLISREGDRGSFRLARGGLDDLRHGVVAAAAFLLGLGEHRIGLQHAEAPPGGRGLAADLDSFCQPDRPGHQRGKGEPDHHRLHYHVRIHEHVPGRQVARQQRDIGRGERRTRQGGRAGRAKPTDHNTRHCSLHGHLPD